MTKEPANQSPILTAAEAMQELGLQKTQLHHLKKLGVLAYVKGYTRESVEQYQQTRRAAGRPKET